MPAIHPLTLKHLYVAFQEGRELDYARLLANAIRSDADDVAAAIRAHVLGDDWLDFSHSALAAYWTRRRGLLYVDANAVHRDFYKVGKTQRTIAGRLKDLNNEAVVGEFICAYSWQVHDCHFLETAAHAALEGFPRHKEFFVGKHKEIKEKIDTCITADIRRFSLQGFSIPTYPE